MNLSNKLTFSLVFSVFLVAAFALVPIAMAAEGGPAVESIVIDNSMTLGHDGNATSDPVIEAVAPAATVSGDNALLTVPVATGLTTAVAGNRVILLDVGAVVADTTDTSTAGYFRLIVTFDEDVYNADSAKPDAPNDPDATLRDQSASRTGAIAVGDLDNTDFTILSAISLATGVVVTSDVTIAAATDVRRMIVSDPTPDDSSSGDEVYDLRKFYVEITVANSALDDLPINVAIVLNADAGVYGIGTNRQISPFKAAQVGIQNEGYVASPTATTPQQPYTQYDFQVVARAIPMLTVDAEPNRTIRSFEEVTLTLTFDPALHESDIPTRTNIKIIGGDLKANDPTTDGDDGLYEVPPVEGSDPPAPANNTQWKLVIVPAGGGGATGTIVVQNAPGAAFVLNETIDVDNTPPTITIAGTAPADGGAFDVSISYNLPPTADLAVGDVTVSNATKGTFTKVSETEYTVNVDPDDPTVSSPVTTVTVEVGQASRQFTTRLTPTITITGTAPADGASFTVTIAYDVAPATALTEADVTVTNGEKSNFSGSGTSYTVDIDPTDPTHGNPVTVTVDVSGTTETFETAVTPPGPNEPITITVDAAIAAKGYLVVGPNTTHTNVLPSVGVTAEDQAGMPDLEDLLYTGGTVDVYVDAGVDANDDPNPTADIIINEVMWALDENAVGTDEHTAHQWIELYNNSDDDAAAETITLRFKRGALDAAPTDIGTRTDRLSNVLRFETTTGWRLGDDHGQSGNSDANAPEEFISMYRAANKRGDNDGINGANWIESTLVSHKNHIGTPGKANTRTQVTVDKRTAPGKDNPSRGVVINEIGNFSGSQNDWIELRNTNATAQSINEWLLSKSTGFGNEDEIKRLPNVSIHANDVLLIYNANSTLPFHLGEDVTVPKIDQPDGTGLVKGDTARYARYLVLGNDQLNIPDDNNWLLILRHGKPWDKNVKQTGFKVVDVAGPGGPEGTFNAQYLKLDGDLTNAHKENKSDGAAGGDIWNTKLFPLNGQLDGNDAFLQGDRLTVDKVWVRDGGKDGFKKDAWKQAPFTGVGYKRGARQLTSHNGTPGFHNQEGNAFKFHDKGNTAPVVINEIMISQGADGESPQWIELRNTSNSTGVSLSGWKLRVTNHDQTSAPTPEDADATADFEGKLTFTINLGAEIPPDQTYLIVTAEPRRARDAKISVPDRRLVNLWRQHRAATGMKASSDRVLNPDGFSIELLGSGNNNAVDEASNLAAHNPNDRRGNNRSFDDTPWTWPSGMTETGERASVSRVTVDSDGTMKDSWISADQVGGKWLNRKYDTYYGSDSDIGTPGHHLGKPLPVQLSFFRPTLEDGQVVIRWTTESELDNAGFNIYRSESRNGEFKQVNKQLIQGKGTTAERSTYKWVDTSAKPGVEYYYQIEDVSFAGEREMLRTTKMKGLISAKDKLTTKWGELKEVQ